MTRKLRWTTGCAAALAVLAGSIAPASARDRGHRGYDRPGGWSAPYRYRHYRHYRRGPDAGAVIGIAALIGAVAVIASSASRDRRESRYPDADERYPSREDDRDYRDGAYSGTMDGDEAVNACASAARDRAESERGGYAEVRDVDPVRATEDGWAVDGRIELRRAYRDSAGEALRFSCDVEGGRVANVYISRDTV